MTTLQLNYSSTQDFKTKIKPSNQNLKPNPDYNRNARAIVKCPVCSKEVQKGSLGRHLGTHKPEKAYKCTYSNCNQDFRTKSDLRKHGLIHTGEKNYICTYCNKTFRSNSDLRRHIQCHTKEKPHLCDVCHKMLPTAHGLTVHKRIHSGEKPYQCAKCDAKFTNHSSLRRHERSHNTEKSFSCDVCKKTFKCSSNMARHKKSHLASNHKCAYWGKILSSSTILREHLRIHTGEKPHVCANCGVPCRTRHILQHHEKSHHLNKKGLKFPCNYCEIQLSQSGLTRHIRVCHTLQGLHNCTVCEKHFGGASELKIHLRSHTGEKPYSCQYCNVRFKLKRSAERHLIAVHTGEKPFKCRKCNKAFARLDNLKLHEKSIQHLNLNN